MNREDFKSHVKTEIENVKSLVKDLLRKKIERADYTQQKQKEMIGTNAPSKNDFGAYVNNLANSIDDVKTEFLIAPSSDSVRRIRTILSEAKNALTKMTSGEVKSVLDELYQLGLLTRFRQYADGGIAVAKTDTSKSFESRKLAFETIMKFVQEQSLKYLGRNLYSVPTNTDLQGTIKSQIRNLVKQQQDYLDLEAPPSGTIMPAKPGAPQPTQAQLENYIRKSYAELPLEKQKEINRSDDFIKFFKAFKEEDLLYSLIAYLKSNDLETDSFAEVKDKLLRDPELVRSTKEKLYLFAKDTDAKPSYFIREVVPFFKRMEKDEEALAGEAAAQNAQAANAQQQEAQQEAELLAAIEAQEARLKQKSKDNIVKEIVALPHYKVTDFKNNVEINPEKKELKIEYFKKDELIRIYIYYAF